MKYGSSQASLKELEKKSSQVSLKDLDNKDETGNNTLSALDPHFILPKLHLSRPNSPLPSTQKRSLPLNMKKLHMKSFLWSKPHLQQGHAEYVSSLFSQLLPVLAVNLGSFSAGLAFAFPTILMPQLVPESTLSTSNSTLSFIEDIENTKWIGSLFFLGAALGGLLSSLLGVITGRRFCLFACTMIDLLGWSLISVTSLFPDASLPLLLGGRVLAGMASSGYLSNIQIYVTEITQTEHRGWMGGLSLPLAGIGVLTMYVLGSLLPWNYTALICILPPVLMAVCLSKMWDTPYSYLIQGKEKEAHFAMEIFRSGDPASVDEIFVIQESIESDFVEGGLLSKVHLLFTKKQYYSPFFILNFLLFLIVFSGITSLPMYANEVFQRIGEHAYLSNIVIGLLQLAGSCLFLPLAKQYSRKLLIVCSSTIISFSLALLGLYLYSQTQYEEFFIAISQSDWLALLCFSAFLISTPAGFCSIPLLYTAELFPTEMRSFLSGMTVTVTSLVILAYNATFSSLESSLMPHGAVWTACAACACACLFCLSFIPETKNKHLSQIPEKFAQWRKEARASPWVTPTHSRSATPSHSRCATPTREINKLRFQTQMFTA